MFIPWWVKLALLPSNGYTVKRPYDIIITQYLTLPFSSSATHSFYLKFKLLLLFHYQEKHYKDNSYDQRITLVQI